MNLRDKKGIRKTLHLSWEEAGGSESKHFFTSSFDLTWYCLRSHLIVPENWADPTSSGLISLDLTHSSLISLLIPTLYHLWPKVLLCARHSQCAGVCGSLQGAWRCFAGHRFNLILSKPGTCLFHGGRWDFIFCPFSPQSHWPIHDLANLDQ